MRIAAKSRQYAQVLLKTAENQNALEAVFRSMLRFYASYRQEPELKAFLASMKISAEKKVELLSKVFPDLHPVCSVFIAQLGDEKDMKLLHQIVKGLEATYYEMSGQIKVHAETTSELSDETLKHIHRAVETVTARKPDVSSGINSQILGGLRLRVGNTILDGSLSTKLAQIRKSLIQS